MAKLQGALSQQKAQAPVSAGPASQTHRDKVGYWIAGLYTLMIGPYAILSRKIGLYDIETDFYMDYILQAQAILKGEMLVNQYHGPGLPLILALLSLLFKDHFLIGMCISVFSAGLTLLMVYLLISQSISKRLAIVTILSMICNHTFLRYSYIASSDMLFNAFLFSTLYSLYLAFRNEKSLYHFISGGLASFSLLVRYNSIFLIPAYIALLLYKKWGDLKSIVRYGGLFLVGYSLFFIPWGLYTLSKTGRFLYNENYANVAWAIYGKDKLFWDDFWNNKQKEFNSYLDVVLKDPAMFFQKIIENTVTNVWYDFRDMIGWYFIPLFVVGLWLFFRHKYWKSMIEITIASASYYLFMTIVMHSDRFSMSLLPFYFSIAWLPFRKELIKGIPLLPIAFFILNAPAFAKAVGRVKADKQNEPIDVIKIAKQFNKMYGDKEKGKSIFARKAQIAYYLGMEFKPIPYGSSIEAVVEEMRKQNVQYLYFSGIEYALRPELRPLQNYQNPPPSLEPVLINYQPFAILYRLREVPHGDSLGAR
jgi:hypothetical protein